jgi:NADH-ubiquinone oxidoreductase chain 6
MYIIQINEFYNIILNVLQILIIICGIFIIINKNPIISILYLIGLFLSVSLYLIVLNITFVGISYLLVYIGAVSILFLFILMLIDIRISELHENNKNNIYLGIVISILFYSIFNNINIAYQNTYNYDNILKKLIFQIKDIFNVNDDKINYISYNNWESSIFESYDLISIGNVLYTSNSILLLIALLILLLAMVGAIKINIK